MEEDNPEGDEILQPHAYVHVLPSKTGESCSRRIVPVQIIKRFDFDVYRNNKEAYKKKKFTIQFAPDGQKHKCFVLFASDNYTTVYNKSQKKRFPIPTHGETMLDNTADFDGKDQEMPQNDIANFLGHEKDDEPQDIASSKKARKQKNEKRKKNKKKADSQVLQNYLNASQELQNQKSDDNTENLQFEANICRTSTPLRKRNRNLEKNKDAMIRAQSVEIKILSSQLQEARKTVLQLKQDFQENSNDRSNERLRVPRCEYSQEINRPRICANPFIVHDKIYGFNKEQEEEELTFDNDGNIHIGFNVYCNANAYYDSFKGKNPYKCLYLLSQGVYGLEELSQRCVRRQSNTLHKAILSPKKKIAIERKVYAFMRMKDNSISQIDDFLDNINKAHHQAIYSAKSRLKSVKNFDDEEARIDAELNHCSTD